MKRAKNSKGSLDGTNSSVVMLSWAKFPLAMYKPVPKKCATCSHTADMHDPVSKANNVEEPLWWGYPPDDSAAKGKLVTIAKEADFYL